MAVAFSWTEGSGERRDFGQLLKLRQGTITQMRDYHSGEAALGSL